MAAHSLAIVGLEETEFNQLVELMKEEKQLFDDYKLLPDYHSALAYLIQETPHCCLTAKHFSGGSAQNLLTELIKFHGGPSFPIVVATHQGKERQAVDLMQIGAQDYVLFEDLNAETLSRTFINAIRTFSLQRQLKQMAHFDTLTGALNRSLFMDRLEQAVLEARRYQRTLSLLCLDIDYFKQINDTYGHDSGDAILKTVSARIRECVRSTDSVGRLGGDEFVVLLPNTPSHTGHYVAQKLLHHIPSPISVGKVELYVYPSIGLASFPDTASDHHQLLKQADAALYRAKGQGRSQYVKFSQHYQTEWQWKNDLAQALPKAIEAGDLKPAYQPIYTTKNGECVSVEALVRWRYGDVEVDPRDVLELIHHGSMAVPYHQWLFQHTLAQLKEWKVQHPDLTLALNMPANLCHNDLIIKALLNTIKSNGLQNADVTIEINESHLTKHAERTKEVLNKLSGKGIRLAIDDFGIGASSLEYLAELPAQQLKIHQRFLIQFHENEKYRLIVEAIAALGQRLGLSVLAVGIENEEMANLVKSFGCEAVQGYFYGRPTIAESDWDTFLANSQQSRDSDTDIQADPTLPVKITP